MATDVYYNPITQDFVIPENAEHVILQYNDQIFGKMKYPINLKKAMVEHITRKTTRV